MKLDLVPVDRIPSVDVIIDAPSRLMLMEVYSICLSMSMICDKHNGIGLAAVQVGIPWRLFIVRNMGGPGYRYFVNCGFESVSDEKVVSIEGCLSLRGNNDERLYYRLPRFKTVRISGFELTSIDSPLIEPVNFVLDDIYSIVFQHEIDHQLGKLISDSGERVEIW